MKKVNFFLLLITLATLTFMSCQQDNNEFDTLQRMESPDINLTEDGEVKRSCGHTHHMEGLLADPDYKRTHQAKLERLANAPQQRAACASPTILPMAVHFQGVSNPDQACLRQLAQAQIAILNADYGGTNGDIAQWNNTAAAAFPGISNGEACIQFCLATKNHPAGSGLNNGDLAVTFNQVTGDNDPQWSGYINIFVRPNLGYLGYSPLGGSGTGDGVVIDANAFGTGAGCGTIKPNSPYDLGRTLTHELGHYLLLDHIWGGNGGCNDDDNVSDTPVSTAAHYGCPSIGTATCNSADMHMNYMDYTNDACMYMFSAGQATRMENFVSTSLQNVANNAANVCGTTTGGGGGTTPTCTDGIQNGNETGVDCGGSCAPCTAAPTCTDGIQNGNETGVDCGGSCQPCTAAPTCTDGIQNGNETGVDCGGSCQPCTAAPTCTDGIQNGDETGVDCGGSCAPCSTGGGTEEIRIKVKPDNYGSEVYWELLDEDYNIIKSGGPYQDNNTKVKTKKATVDTDGCYTFVIYDDYGDGICCNYGNGWYKILDSSNNVLIQGDGNYGYYDEQDFCFTANREAAPSSSKVNFNKVAQLKSSAKAAKK